MTYARDGQTIKEFRAVCPVTRFMATRVCARATAGNAKRFLLDLLDTLRFPLASIQVDGFVDRANRSARAEFWSLYDGPPTVADISPALSHYEFFYNYQRLPRLTRLSNPQRVPCPTGGRLIPSVPCVRSRYSVLTALVRWRKLDVPNLMRNRTSTWATR